MGDECHFFFFCLELRFDLSHSVDLVLGVEEDEEQEAGLAGTALYSSMASFFLSSSFQEASSSGLGPFLENLHFSSWERGSMSVKVKKYREAAIFLKTIELGFCKPRRRHRRPRRASDGGSGPLRSETTMTRGKCMDVM